ncbi:MarR family transcriptional regulator [Streptomyces sp. HU2014]|uniref:MarR family winged helix-turn-helix transcriptional regulator n=1 Tax=Streptomyces sp. HU2014 TaxID=2939414 RepID=UPI00200F9F8B|nr:MarR family transcriptional regulator [Streptomyces sp. HU2014]UQI43787.1 MarR family transcriptional regulator [Streptomyces sp. HU2014]
MTTHPHPHSPPPQRSAAAERAWGNLRQIVLGGNERRKEVVEALGMSFFRVKALRRIARGPVTLRELADQLVTDRPYTTLVVADLAERGLVERTANPADRRSKIVSVTAPGRAAAERAERILGAPPSALLALPEEDLAALDRIAARLVDPGPERP